MDSVGSAPALRIPKRFSWMMPVAPLLALLPVPLSAVLRMSGSDKERAGGHHYGKTYDAVLRRFKYARFKLLEIGIGGNAGGAGGESLAAWRSYFPFAKIVGADLIDKRVLARRNLQIHVVDQSSEAALEQLIALEAPFDVIIDDGSHISAHQILTFEKLFPHLNDGGVYIVEDVQTSYWKAWGGESVASEAFGATCMGYFCELAKYVNYPEFEGTEGSDPKLLALARDIRSIAFEHNLIVLHKERTERRSNR